MGCREVPAPSEIQRARAQEQDLWRAGASLYFPSDYEVYLQALRRAEGRAAKEKMRLGWFRNYGPVIRDYRDVLAAGDAVLERISAYKREQTDSLERDTVSLRERLTTLDGLSLSLVERGEGRSGVTQAGILLREAEVFLGRGEFEKAKERIAGAEDCLAKAEAAILAYVGRYRDEAEVRVWKRWAEETVAESKKKGNLAIIVSKLERKLTVYRKGRPLQSYDVGLGLNGLLTKTMSGDNATPEGKYRVIAKNPHSQYHKALLINYPNEDDKKRFAQAQRAGLIPKNAVMGGDIEIHGGGRDILTRGCVSLDNDRMDELFDLVGVGTPVTIIGTTDAEAVIGAIGRR